MADATYITKDATTKRNKEVTATKTGGTPTTDSQIVETDNTTGKISPTLIPDINQTSLPATENLSAGAMVNVYSNGGVTSMRNADNSTGKYAHGWVNAAVTSGQNGVFNSTRGGYNTGVSGLTPDTDYWVGTVGAVVVAASAPGPGSGNFLQYAGYTTAAGVLLMLLESPSEALQR